MKILITGGGGYKGLKLAKRLLEERHEVTIFDNFMYGQDPCLFLFSYPAARFICKDIRNVESSDLAGMDCVYHLAGISGYPACEANPHSAEMINVGGTEKLLAAMAPSQLLVYASTTSIYGRAGDNCDERTHVEPASLYASTKYKAEELCMDRPSSIAFRFATIFGVSPRMRWDLMPNDFAMRAVQERSLVLFDSKSVRTFLHLDDAIGAYVMAIDKADQMVGEVFNVGCRQMNLSKRQIAEKIAEQVDFSIIDSSLTDPDVRNFVINFDKLASLGFEPARTLEEGISELVKLFRFYRPTQPFRVI